ncbi:hypothetical protein BJX76DRAFT_318076 [Aspergillus varians]
MRNKGTETPLARGTTLQQPDQETLLPRRNLVLEETGEMIIRNFISAPTPRMV